MKNKFFGLILFSGILNSCLSFSSFAMTLEGKITFQSKAPTVSLIYFKENLPANKNPTFIDQKNKQFAKNLVVLSKDSNIMFKNSDTFEHNIYITVDDTKVIDIGLEHIGSKKVEKVTWEEGKVAKVSCKIHPEMVSWIASVNSKYYSIVDFAKDKSKNFVIKDVPDNLSKVRIWFPKSEEIEIEIKKGQSKSLEIKNKESKKVIGVLKLEGK